MAGRHSKYSDKLAATICERIACGESLVSICKDKAMPGYSTVMRWINECDSFRDKYAHAKEAGAEYEAQRIIEIADDPDIDPNHKRIMVDARKWTASKLKPKVYGDRQQVEHSGRLDIESAVTMIYETYAPAIQALEDAQDTTDG